MKKFVILVLIAFLCACKSQSGDVFNELDNTFAVYDPINSTTTNNTNTSLYSLYIPSDMTELDYGENYHYIGFDESDFIMNLNINGILSSSVFEKEEIDPYSYLSEYSIYKFEIFGEYGFRYNLYVIDDQLYFSFYSPKLTAFGSTTYEDVTELARHILVINSSMNIDNEKVIDKYYSGTTIESTHVAIDEYTTHHPTNGDVYEIIKENE